MEVALNVGRSVVLVDDGAGLGTGVVRLGPDSRGAAYWTVDDVVMMTDRPGQAPVPRVIVYLDTISASGLQGVTYDASFNSANAKLKLQRGQELIFIWADGQIGDIATVSLTGTQSDMP